MVRNSVCVEGGSGTDSSVNGVAQSVVHRQIDYEIVETTCYAVSVVLSVNTL